MSREKNARSERTGQVQLCGKEAAFTFPRKSHGQAFESALQMPKRTKRPIRKDWSFCGKIAIYLFTIHYYLLLSKNRRLDLVKSE